jgi:peptidoglycan/LPS O-acetylase OafA/YrhL
MGILRTLLAIIVMLSHFKGEAYAIGEKNAVRLFFIISGFLIFYLLCYKKSYSTNSNFFISRFVRIYPIYLIIFLITLIPMLIINYNFKNLIFFDMYKSIQLDGLIYLIFANASLFLHDLSYFLTISDDGLKFTSNFSLEKIQIWNGLVITQAWTLSIELMFYLIAPFIFKTNVRVIILFFITLIIKFFITTSHFNYDPLNYRFFFGELFFFMFGALSCKIMLPFYKIIITKTYLKVISLLAVLFSIFLIFILYSFLDKSIHSIIVLLVVTFLLLPLLFIFSDYFKYDKNIGEFSYTIFISHMLILRTVNYFKIEFLNESEKIILLSFLTIIFSYFLNRFISRPIENFRTRFKK